MGWHSTRAAGNSGLRVQVPPLTFGCELTAIPYYARANRGATQMRAWIPGR